MVDYCNSVLLESLGLNLIGRLFTKPRQPPTTLTGPLTLVIPVFLTVDSLSILALFRQ